VGFAHFFHPGSNVISVNSDRSPGVALLADHDVAAVDTDPEGRGRTASDTVLAPGRLNLVGRIIAARCGQGSAGAPRDLFDLLATARDPDSSALFPPDRLTDQVATMIVAAGHETTAVALFWSLYLLASAPTIQDRLAAEVAVSDLGPDNAAAALPTLLYTRAVVHEAVAAVPAGLHLGAPSAPRRCRWRHPGPGAHRGLDRPLGFAPPAAGCGRGPKSSTPRGFCPQPPDRFAYLPFGIGPRVCIGAQFALTEATLVLATLIQTLHIERADDVLVTPRAVVATQPDRPLPFRLQLVKFDGRFSA
jgi:Cytochrome P450